MKTRIYFMLVRRVPPEPSAVLMEVFSILGRSGYEVEAGIAEEAVLRPDHLTPAHDLYVLKSHTELSLSLAGILHSQEARLLNPYPSCLVTQNKIVTSWRLRQEGVPTPSTWVTGDFALLRSTLVRETPLIIKPYLGHRGEGITIVRQPHELASLPPPERPVVVQEFVPGSGEDLKVYVAGDQVYAVRKPFSATSFTQPGQPCRVDPEVRDIALRCGRALGLGLYGLDIIESPAGPVVVDVNFFPGYKGIPNIAPVIADYIESYARGHCSLYPPSPAVQSARTGGPAFPDYAFRPRAGGTRAGAAVT
ncbi:MAG: ATP-grasp domain-containing protein [Chloroflexi bacterium]|nr:ATP-grasp domain-containing protein [Chloroflexota bacterium]